MTSPQAPEWGQSLWVARNPPTSAAPLRENLDVDVAIVGGGVAGLSTAFHLAAQGIEAVVLEAEHLAAGATGVSGGVVAPQLVRTTPSAILKRLGAEAGGRYLGLLAGSGRYLFDLIRSESLDCAAQPLGFLSPVSGGRALEQTRRLIEEWTPFRQDLTLALKTETREITGCEGYDACLVDPSGGGLDPVAFAHGLAAKLPSRGIRLFQNSRVLALTARQSRWLITTPEGSILARRVVLCANGGNSSLHPALAQTILPLPVYQVATQPLALMMRRTILPFGHTLTDASANVFTIRFDIDGRLITACSAQSEMARDELDRRINQRLVANIPSYSATPLEYGWKGTAWLNSSLLPRVLAVDVGLLAIQACNGRGLALNTIIGREVAGMLTSTGSDLPAIPVERPRRVRGYALARHIPGLVMAGAALGRKVYKAAANVVGR